MGIVLETLRRLGPPVVGILGLLLLSLLLLLALPALGPPDYTLDDRGPSLVAALALIGIGIVGTKVMGEQESGPAPAARVRRALVLVLYWGSFASALLAFGVLKHLVFLSDPGKIYPDTSSYVRVAELSLLSQPFWFGERPFTLPLLYKALHVTTDNYRRPEVLSRIQVFQAWFGAAAWILLAGVVAKSVKSRWMRPASLGFILLFSLNLHVSQWDTILLSESISTSLFAGLTAVLVILLLALGARQHDWRQGLTVLVGAVILVLFSFTRDANLPILVLATLACLGMSAVGLHEGRSIRVWLVASALLTLAFVGQLRGIEYSDRWTGPYYGVLQDRILVDRQAREFFLERGMPDGELIEDILTMDRRDFHERMRRAEPFRELWQWTEDHGRGTYLGYLIRRPGEVVTAPIRERDHLLNPLSTEYRHPDATTPGWLMVVTPIVYPRQTPIMVLWTGLVVAAVVLAARWKRIRPQWYLALLLAFVAYGLMILAWYADSIEVERHVYQAAFQLRLSLLLLSLWAADGLSSSKDRSSA